jgi:hypothetical protein
MIKRSSGGAAIATAIGIASEGKLVASGDDDPREPYSNMSTKTISTLCALIREVQAMTSGSWLDRGAIERATIESKSKAVFDFVMSIGFFDASHHTWQDCAPSLYNLSTPIEIIAAAIEHYGDENLKCLDEYNFCSLHHAAECKNAEAVRLLLERVPSLISVKNSHKETALVSAAQNNSVECVERIVTARIEKYETSSGKSRIHDFGVALGATTCISCVRQLLLELPYHRHLKTLGERYMKALSSAACGHHYEILSLLFEHRPPEADMQVLVAESFASIVYKPRFPREAMLACLELLRITEHCNLSVDMPICCSGHNAVVDKITMLTAAFSTVALLSEKDRVHMQAVIDRLFEMGASVNGLWEGQETMPDTTPFAGACAALSEPLILSLIEKGANPYLTTRLHPLLAVVGHASNQYDLGRQKKALAILDLVLCTFGQGADRCAEFVNRHTGHRGGHQSLLSHALCNFLVPSLDAIEKFLRFGADPNGASGAAPDMLLYRLADANFAVSEEFAFKVCKLFFSYGASLAGKQIEYDLIDDLSPNVSDFIRERHEWSSAQLLASATEDDDDTAARVVLRNRRLSFTERPGTPTLRELCQHKPRLLACLEAAKTPFSGARNHFFFPLWHRQTTEAVLSSSVISRGATRLPALPFEVWIIILRLLGGGDEEARA